ncbi:MAG: UDP-N-acetylmuramoyl-tripeptide--D-alanyl-D-alanine ligase [Nitriliruptoraceae bacterium]
MIATGLDHIAEVTGGHLDPPAEDLAAVAEVDAVTTDSRSVPPGAALFVALRGEHRDGHDHAQQAVAAGAVALLAERPLSEPAVPTVVVDDTWRALRELARDVRRRVDPVTVAITGSVGKTTVKDLTAAAVAAGRRTHAARGSYNNELGVPLTLCGLEADTEVLVAEVGARQVGDIADLADLVAPDIAVVTAVAAVHLEVFGSLEAVARAKGELVEALGPDGLAVLNLADPNVAAMAARAPEVLTVATDLPEADVHAVDVRLDRHARASATAVTPWGGARLELSLAGRHQLVNALFALAVAGRLGVDPTAAAAAIGAATVSPWRGEIIQLGGVTVLNDAYNANPTSVAAALETLVSIERSGRTVAVLGEMAEIGADSADEHARIGRRCAELGVDLLIGVGEVADRTVRAAAEDGDTEVVHVADAVAAADHLDARLAPGDVVLVKASRVAGLEEVVERLGERRRVEVDP